MKLFITKGMLFLATILLTNNAFTQVTSKIIPELVFQNPVLFSGSAGADGAVYKFSNVTSGIDALVKIVKRSSSSVVLTNIDVSNMGWNKAFQPQLGVPGTVGRYKNWWMEFEITFLDAGTAKEKKIKSFAVTSLDVDGDNVSISEYVQMQQIKTIKYSPFTYLTNGTPLTTVGDDDDDNEGVNKLVQGPVRNFTDIDTSATSVMATYTYEEKESISFVIGAKTGNATSTAGERLNSLWFKTFDLSPKVALPLKLTSFTAVYDKKNVVLNWVTAFEENFSHFVIERSTDGKNYSEAALVFAFGNTSQESKYVFKDAGVSSVSGAIYYRIRFVENNKETYYSDVRLIRLAKDGDQLQLAAYPNPASSQVRVTLPNKWQGKKVVLELYNNNSVRVQSAEFGSASQTETLQIASLPEGVYFIQAVCEGERVQNRILKN